ncbi:MAG: ABC transporter permease [Thermoprotei archaeon]|nr:MAG: ABC transporter permease [Thermoprotei archaeon]
MMEAVKAVFKAYFTTELVRSRGLVFGLMNMVLWILLFMAPIILFRPSNLDPSITSAYAFAAVLVFMSYSMATWDWAWELRWLMTRGLLEYIIASGRSIFILYVGILPVSFMWTALALTLVYGLLSLLAAPPAIIINDPYVMAIGFTLFIIVLFAHALILGGTTISVGTSGPVMEFISWLMPIATGGLVPLRNMPVIIQKIAICTPYSYPAELIRYSILGVEPILSLQETILYGSMFAMVYIMAAMIYFRMQLKKLLKEGPKTVGMY